VLSAAVGEKVEKSARWREAVAAAPIGDQQID
jgi:hypothetical protein